MSVNMATVSSTILRDAPPAREVSPTVGLIPTRLLKLLGHTIDPSVSVPSVAAAFAIQTAVAVPSVFAQSELFYDVSGSVTYLAVTALSLYLPALRARNAASLAGGPVPAMPGLLAPFTNPAAAGLNWRQVVLSGAVSLWATRRMLLTEPLCNV